MVMGIVPAHEHSKRTEDEWVEAIKTEYVECAKKTKFNSKAEAMAACLRLATNVRLVGFSFSLFSFDLLPFPINPEVAASRNWTGRDSGLNQDDDAKEKEEAGRSCWRRWFGTGNAPGPGGGLFLRRGPATGAAGRNI